MYAAGSRSEFELSSPLWQPQSAFWKVIRKGTVEKKSLLIHILVLQIPFLASKLPELYIHMDEA